MEPDPGDVQSLKQASEEHNNKSRIGENEKKLPKGFCEIISRFSCCIKGTSSVGSSGKEVGVI